MYFEQILFFKHHLGLTNLSAVQGLRQPAPHLQNHTICAKRKNYIDWATKHKHT